MEKVQSPRFSVPADRQARRNCRPLGGTLNRKLALLDERHHFKKSKSPDRRDLNARYRRAVDSGKTPDRRFRKRSRRRDEVSAEQSRNAVSKYQISADDLRVD